jgi:general nucleoside transport system ATP-binding protein
VSPGANVNPLPGAPPPAVELRGIDKRFGLVHANRHIDLVVPVGTIHGIVGENGAGKSTLMNILYGFYQADSGDVLVDGKPTVIRGPQDAIRDGIGMVHQHFMLVEPFTVLENLLLGAEGGLTLAGGAERARQEVAALERDYGLEVDLDAPVASLPVGVQQRVEILKALFRGARVLILDEPTGVLTPQEADHLFRILRNLKAQGRTIVLITHKLREIMAVTDQVSVMRAGAMVAHRRTAETSKEELAELMVGRKVLLRVEKGPARPREPVLEVRDLVVAGDQGVPRVKGISFTVRSGEILGIAGVAGNGQSELLDALAGIRRPLGGEILLRGAPITGGAQARLLRCAHVPEDRLRVGLVKGFTAYENAILGYQTEPDYAEQGFLKLGKIVELCRTWMRGYDVRPCEPRLDAHSFSGGNQQKLVLAREMEHDPDLLLVGQPTRGVDIGAIEFIHKRLIAMRDAGKAVLLVSVELDEILSLSDRILVMFDGTITGELSAAEADERRVGLLMAGITKEAA